MIVCEYLYSISNIMAFVFFCDSYNTTTIFNTRDAYRFRAALSASVHPISTRFSAVDGSCTPKHLGIVLITSLILHTHTYIYVHKINKKCFRQHL